MNEMEEVIDPPKGFNQVCERKESLDYIVAYHNPETEKIMLDFTNQLVGPITVKQLKLLGGFISDILFVLRK